MLDTIMVHIAFLLLIVSVLLLIFTGGRSIIISITMQMTAIVISYLGQAGVFLQ